MVLALLRSSLRLESGILYLFIGPGLLALRRGWRTCALAFIWLGFLFLPIFGLFVISHPKPIPFTLFDVPLAQVAPTTALIATAALFLVNLWQYRVLTSPDIRHLFGLA